jgi:hypothetical protein
MTLARIALLLILEIQYSTATHNIAINKLMKKH